MLKILFVASGNKTGKPGAVVQNQADSIVKAGHTVDFYLIKGKGIKGYLKNLASLRKQIIEGNYDIIHAHGFSSLLATLSFRKPLVVSLLGSEVHENPKLYFLFRFLVNKYWDATIVKSPELKELVAKQASERCHIIPNGVDTEIFSPIPIRDARQKVGWNADRPVILFMANPERPSKNVELAQEAMKQLTTEAELKIVYGVDRKSVPDYLNAANVVVLTSRWEGSPNIIKEAMACNRPIVSTDVGDVKWLFGNVEGQYFTGFDAKEVAGAMDNAISFDRQTKGRKRIMELGISSDKIADRIVEIYKKVTPK